MGLLASSDGEMRCTARDTLQTALAAVQGSHDASKNAWVMRHALDWVYESMSN
jgi:hypothetical protein